MSDKTAISWCDATLNVVTGCTKVSPGCTNCYIVRTPPFYYKGRKFEYKGKARGVTTGVQLHPERLNVPQKWKKPLRIFVNSLSDLFHEEVPDEFIDKVFAMMASTPRHTYQVLSKRPDRMRDYILHAETRVGALVFTPSEDETIRGRRTSNPTPQSERDDGQRSRGSIRDEAESNLSDLSAPDLETRIIWPLPNVWIGVSVENQHWADIRIPSLLEIPAAVRFLSVEPMLEPVELGTWMWSAMTDEGKCAIDWVIVGGESGPNYRPFESDWARAIRDQCVSAGVPFFFKQYCGMTPGGNNVLDGQIWHQFPGNLAEPEQAMQGALL